MRIVVWVLAILLLGVLFAGCYTLLVHPNTDADVGYHHSARTCSDCHASSDYYYWHNPYYYNWYWRYPYWRSYYYDPWWWDDYWYYDDDSDAADRPNKDLWQPRIPPGSTPDLAPGTKTKNVPATPGGTRSNDDTEVREEQPEQPERQLWKPRTPPKKEKQKTEPEKEERKTKED